MGFKGLTVETKSTSAIKPLTGFRGISVEVNVNLTVKITDKRGRGLPGARVVINNPTSGVPSEMFTDSQGNALMDADGSNPNPIQVFKDKAFTTMNYTGGNSITIVLDPPLL